MSSLSSVEDDTFVSARVQRLLDDYAAHGVRSDGTALHALRDGLRRSEAADWLAAIRALILRGDFAGAESLATASLDEHAGNGDVKRVLAGILQQTRRPAAAEALLGEVLAQRPADVGAALALAKLLIARGRTTAAADALRKAFDEGGHDAEAAIVGIELLDECDRIGDAAAVADGAIAANPHDARLRAYSAMLHNRLGDFARAREHYRFVIEHDARAFEWHAPHGLASTLRYENSGHADFGHFRLGLQRHDLSPRARTSLLFAIAKGYDDSGDFGVAAQYFREGNALARAHSTFSRKLWRRVVEGRLASKASAIRLEAPSWQPVFVIGMPRSGTTLVAEHLARRKHVCNRGELPWLARISTALGAGAATSREALQRAATDYAMRLLQDDAAARWYIDKNPLNFRHVGLIMTLWPNARIVYCTRSARDTALSLWTQWFLSDEQGYAYDFTDIATVMRDCTRLMVRWRNLYADSIREVAYEDMVADADATTAGLAAWLGMSERDTDGVANSGSISTASLWQARQPIYTRSVQRWRGYVDHVPELLSFSER